MEGVSYTSPRSMRPHPRTRRSSKPGRLAKLRLRHRTPTCWSSRAPNARCGRGHLPWPNSTDHRPFRTRPLKPVPTLAHNGRLLTVRQPPFIESSPRRYRWTIATDLRQSPVRPDIRESSAVHRILHARPGNTSGDLDPNPTSSRLPDATFHRSLARSASSHRRQYKRAAGSNSAHLQIISFEDWRR
jgi:hypothetical protein